MGWEQRLKMEAETKQPDQLDLLVSGLELLNVADKSLIVLKTPAVDLPEGAEAKIVGALQRYCERQKLTDISLIVLPGGCEVSVVNEETMAVMGWKRKSNLVLAAQMPNGGGPH